MLRETGPLADLMSPEAPPTDPLSALVGLLVDLMSALTGLASAFVRMLVDVMSALVDLMSEEVLPIEPLYALVGPLADSLRADASLGEPLRSEPLSALVLLEGDAPSCLADARTLPRDRPSARFLVTGRSDAGVVPCGSRLPPASRDEDLLVEVRK